jgi:hypothetical protein
MLSSLTSLRKAKVPAATKIKANKIKSFDKLDYLKQMITIPKSDS